jgi:hypothetical protein
MATKTTERRPPSRPVRRRRSSPGFRTAREKFTRDFYEHYNDEAWAYITPEDLRSDGTGLHGFDIKKLNTYLTALRN